MEGYGVQVNAKSEAPSYTPMPLYSSEALNPTLINSNPNNFMPSNLCASYHNNVPHAHYAPSKEGIYHENDFERQIYNYFLEKYSTQLKDLPEQYKEMLKEGEVYKAAYHILKDVYAQNTQGSKLRTEKDIQFFYDLMKLYVLGAYKEGLSNEDKEYLFYEAAPLYLDKQGLLPAETLAAAVRDTKNGYSIIIKNWLTDLSDHKYLMEVLAHEFIHILQYYAADSYNNGELPAEKDMEAQATLHSLELLRQIDENYRSLADPVYISWAEKYAKDIGINPTWVSNPQAEKYISDGEKHSRYWFNPEYYAENEKEISLPAANNTPKGIIKEPRYKPLTDDEAVNRGVLH